MDVLLTLFANPFLNLRLMQKKPERGRRGAHIGAHNPAYARCGIFDLYFYPQLGHFDCQFSTSMDQVGAWNEKKSHKTRGFNLLHFLVYNIEGKISWDRGNFFLIFFPTRAKFLTPDWSSGKITRIWLAERGSTLLLRWPPETDFWRWVVQHNRSLRRLTDV